MRTAIGLVGALVAGVVGDRAWVVSRVLVAVGQPAVSSDVAILAAVAALALVGAIAVAEGHDASAVVPLLVAGAGALILVPSYSLLVPAGIVCVVLAALAVVAARQRRAELDRGGAAGIADATANRPPQEENP